LRSHRSDCERFCEIGPREVLMDITLKLANISAMLVAALMKITGSTDLDSDNKRDI
jgi:hypothetical protein